MQNSITIKELGTVETRALKTALTNKGTSDLKATAKVTAYLTFQGVSPDKEGKYSKEHPLFKASVKALYSIIRDGSKVSELNEVQMKRYNACRSVISSLPTKGKNETATLTSHEAKKVLKILSYGKGENLLEKIKDVSKLLGDTKKAFDLNTIQGVSKLKALSVGTPKTETNATPKTATPKNKK